MKPAARFDALSPMLALEAIEEAYELRLDGTISTFSSYINRVYGLRGEEGEGYVAKFYRPGRWSEEAIAEEHGFIADCAALDIPAVVPLANSYGETISALEIDTDEGETVFPFALFPKHGGRQFDAEGDEDWTRLGAMAGRIHAAGRRGVFHERNRFDSQLVRGQVQELKPLVHPELSGDFTETVDASLQSILPRLDSFEGIRIHGDLHRGNILERPDEGLLVIDFDDCLRGPPIQDLWLLLPDRSDRCTRELSLLIEGYSEFAELEQGSVAFIESLRFLRMIHFLAWRARQRSDLWFARDFPDWGTRAFWIKEVEDLREQARNILEVS